MKSTKKILALLLAAVMVVGMLAGCNSKEKDPKELFVNAFEKYHTAVKDNKVVKLLENSLAGGALNMKMESGEGDTKESMDLTMYMDKSGKAGSVAMNTNIEGKQVELKLLLNNKKVVLGSNALEKSYGVDLEKFKENLPNSLFGTKGENILDLTEESEQELFKMLDELNAQLKAETKQVDVYKVLMDTLTANGTFAADTKTPVTIDGKEVKNTTVTVTFTKDNMKSIVNKMVAELELQKVVDELIATMNEEAKWDAEMSETTAKTYENMNDVLDEVFEGKEGDDVVFTMKLVLDTKHDAIMVMELTAEKTVTIDFGADPTNITKVVITYPTEEMPVDSTKPITKMQKLTLNINKSATSEEYKLLDEHQDGLVLVINKAHREITFSEVIEGKPNADDAYTFKYELTDSKLALTFTDEGDEYSDPSTVTITFTANVESPVKFDDYKDLLTLSKSDFEAMMNELLEFAGMEGNFNFDEMFGEDTPDMPDIEIDGPGTSKDDMPENTDPTE